MCSAFGLNLPRGELIEYLGGLPLPASFEPKQRFAPSEDILTVSRREDGNETSLRRWGLLPNWEHEFEVARKKAMINARGETLLHKPFFAQAAKQRRCVIVASHFFEWQKEGKARHPFRFESGNEPLLRIAGVWNSWSEGPGRPTVESVALVTIAANQLMAPIHDRMPALLSHEMADRWLEKELAVEQIEGMLQSAPEEWLEATALLGKVG